MSNPTPEPVTPRVGDIWQEADLRFTRYVRVEFVGKGRRSVAIRTVLAREGGGWMDGPRSRVSYADIERFTKRTGYRLHERKA